ncbi:metallophosphoesterase family protein [Thalassoroseus pseudoceratinae]|uniref:metallophosphoesterase family protein n=1 Tax=Thalassoroseus pseudoceratinae TaxID=2713176 RepID=UPI0014224FF3|nr:metallophosphoesterase family protein [Thalassoroseus pseudoceratinae]
MSDRVFAIGDIHGCDTALNALLDRLKLTPTDTVVVLGDIVDRGPGSRQVIERLMTLHDECNFVLIRGNHDEMMIKAYEGTDSYMSAMWLQVGGLEALESYGGQTLGLVPEAHINFLKTSVDYWETETDVFIHGNLRPEIPLQSQHWEAMRWEHLSGVEAALPDGRRVVCGHTSQKDGRPVVMEGWVCIDTFASGSGWLTALETGTNEIYRSKETGQIEGPLWLDEVANEFHR